MTLSLLVALLALACSRQAEERRSSAHPQPLTQGDTEPLVRIEVDPVSRLDTPLKLRWRISNGGARPVYVYSTILQQPAAAEINIDVAQRIIEVRLSRLQPISVGVNSFPEAQFMQMGPKEVKEGEFESVRPVNQEDPGITSGNWRVRILVAYGYEIESVKKALAESIARGEEHPINPIVRWQKVSYSDPVSVLFEK